MAQFRVWLPVAFGDSYTRIVFKYLDQGRWSLSRAEWSLAFEAFDLLGDALIDTPDGLQHFKALYESQIEANLANRYIADLLKLDNVPGGWTPLWARYARAIFALWQRSSWLEGVGVEARLLLGYWLFWWEMFAEGYAFEVQVLEDLEQSGVAFAPHDLRTRQGRRSPYDLAVLGLHGDIKTSLYFLQHGRSPGMRRDFYISRFRYRGREKVMIVLMQPLAWQKIDGEAERATWEQLKAELPTVASILHRGRQIVVVDYETWKARVRRRQQQEEGNERANAPWDK
ncbi:MAG: hypothetical protein JW850_21860 [Thermoflexales bacterium]|nr:hypothetical protein [Thermoflexales bacterium]